MFYLYLPNSIHLTRYVLFYMRTRKADFNLFTRVVLIIFIVEQLIFMALVFYQKGTSIIDFLADQWGFLIDLFR